MGLVCWFFNIDIMRVLSPDLFWDYCHVHALSWFVELVVIDICGMREHFRVLGNALVIGGDIPFDR